MPRCSLPLAAAATLLALFTLWWAGSGTLLADFGGDNAVYFLTANHYSPWGTRHPAAAEFAARSVYPPLYAWVLALGGGGVSLAGAHRVTALVVVLAGVAAWSWLRTLGLPRAVALVALALLAVTRMVLLEGIELHSEHLYLALWLAAAALCANDRPSARALLLAALAVGGAYLTRSFGVTLVVTLLAWLAWHRPAGAWRAALLALLPVLLLNLFHHGNARYLHDMLALYTASGPWARLAANGAALWPAWQGAFGVVGQPGFLGWLPAVLALFAVAGLAPRLRAARFDAWSVLAYLVLMCAWPYPAEYERMCYPLLPFALGYALVAGRALLPRLAPALAWSPALALWLAAIAPFALLVQARLAAPPADPGLAPYLRSSAWFEPDPGTAYPTLAYQRALTEALQSLGRPGRLPAGACLRATKPSVAAALSGLLADGYPAFELDDASTLDALARGRCQYLFIMMGASPSFPQYYYPLKRLRASLEVLQIFPNPLAPQQAAALLARLARQPP